MCKRLAATPHLSCPSHLFVPSIFLHDLTQVVHAQLTSAGGMVDLGKFMGQQARLPAAPKPKLAARVGRDFAAQRPMGSMLEAIQKKKNDLHSASSRILKSAKKETRDMGGLKSALENGIAKMNLPEPEDTMGVEQDWTISS